MGNGKKQAFADVSPIQHGVFSIVIFVASTGVQLTVFDLKLEGPLNRRQHSYSIFRSVTPKKSRPLYATASFYPLRGVSHGLE